MGINFDEVSHTKARRWRAEEPVSAKKLNEPVDIVNRFFGPSATPPQGQGLDKLIQSPILFIATAKAETTDELVKAKRVFINGNEADVERSYAKLTNQEIGIGEQLGPIGS